MNVKAKVVISAFVIWREWVEGKQERGLPNLTNKTYKQARIFKP